MLVFIRNTRLMLHGVLIAVLLTALAACDGNSPTTKNEDPLLKDITLQAWVGETESELTLSAEVPGAEFFGASERATCDLSDYAACKHGEMDVKIAIGEPFISKATTLTQSGSYRLTRGTDSAEVDLGTARFSGRAWHQVVKFQGRLWLFGGYSYADNAAQSDVWSSADGINWIQEIDNANFGVRSDHQVVAFDAGGGETLWMFGGTPNASINVMSSIDGVNWESRHNDLNLSDENKNTLTDFPSLRNHQVVIFDEGSATGKKIWLLDKDGKHIWSSANGIEWVRQTTQSTDANIELKDHNRHQIVVFKNKLWLLGGITDDSATDDVWSSPDGVNWTPETAATNFPVIYAHQAITVGDKLWVTGGHIDTNNGYNGYVWSSTDGINWKEEVVEAAFGSRYATQLVNFDNGLNEGNKLWLIAGNGKNDVWSSKDGKDWTLETPAAADFSPRLWHQAVLFDDGSGAGEQIWVIGGWDDDNPQNDDIWSSPDGFKWTQHTPVNTKDGPAFSARSGHQLVVFKQQLWLIGGHDKDGYKNDVWSSSDGVNWTPVNIKNTASGKPAFAPRHYHQVVVFDDGTVKGEQLWLLGGSNALDTQTKQDQALNDVWSSSDGESWTEITPNNSATTIFSGRFGHTAVVFDKPDDNKGNLIWVIGGVSNVNNQLYNDVWSFDGNTWTDELSQHEENGTSFTSRAFTQLAVFNEGNGEKMWLVGGLQKDNITSNEAWSSTDGKNWTLESGEAGAPFDIDSHQMLVMGDDTDKQLLIIGGWSSSANGGLTNNLWKSRNGRDWKKAFKAHFHSID